MRALGFALGPAGVHAGRGTSNHLAILPGAYWEILAVDEAMPVNRHLQTLFAAGGGLVGCALATNDIDVDSARLSERGIDVGEPQDVSRPLITGQDARFRVAQLGLPFPFHGHFFFCQHLTPELVWPADPPHHPNSAVAISALTVVSANPRSTAQDLAGLFGVEPEGAGGCDLSVGAMTLRCVNVERFEESHPDFSGHLPDAPFFSELVLSARSDGGLSRYAPALGPTVVTLHRS